MIIINSHFIILLFFHLFHVVRLGGIKTVHAGMLEAFMSTLGIADSFPHAQHNTQSHRLRSQEKSYFECQIVYEQMSWSLIGKGIDSTCATIS